MSFSHLSHYKDVANSDIFQLLAPAVMRVSRGAPFQKSTLLYHETIEKLEEVGRSPKLKYLDVVEVGYKVSMFPF
jgi:hypothetical protein